MTELFAQPEHSTFLDLSRKLSSNSTMGGGIYDGLDTTIEGTVGGALIIVGGVALIAMFFVCMYRRFQRMRRRFDDKNDIEQGRRKRNSHKRGNDHDDRLQAKRRKHEEKKRKIEKAKKDKTEGDSDEKDKHKNKKRVEETDSDDTEDKKKARKEKEKMEKKIEKKLKEKMEKKMDRKLDEMIDKRSKREKKHHRRHSSSHHNHHHHRHHNSSRSRRRRHYEREYYDPDGYYSNRRASYPATESWNYGYYGPYSNNDSLWQSTAYPNSIVTKTTAPESIGSSWRSDRQESIFLSSPVKPLRTSGLTLPTTDIVDQISWSSTSDDTFPGDEDTEETPSSMESFSKFLIQQLSIYRSAKTHHAPST